MLVTSGLTQESAHLPICLQDGWISPKREKSQCFQLNLWASISFSGEAGVSCTLLLFLWLPWEDRGVWDWSLFCSICQHLCLRGSPTGELHPTRHRNCHDVPHRVPHTGSAGWVLEAFRPSLCLCVSVQPQVAGCLGSTDDWVSLESVVLGLQFTGHWSPGYSPWPLTAAPAMVVNPDSKRWGLIPAVLFSHHGLEKITAPSF
jgi:hypothetical protein